MGVLDGADVLDVPDEELESLPAAGVDEPAELLLPSDELEEGEEPAPSPDDELAAGFGLEYRSLYHPLPLNETAGAEMTRSSGPLQCGQFVISGSENF